MRRLALAFCLLAAGPASALSCVAPTIASTYSAAAASPADYVIGVGYMTQTGLPEGHAGGGDASGDWRSYRVEARFIGDLFTGTGFDQPRDLAVTVEVSCVGHWCGGHGNLPYGLFFLRRDAGGHHVLESSPCPFWVFPEPGPADLAQVVACHRGGGC